MLKAFVDTSVLLRILVKDDDAKRKAAENLLKTAKEQGITLYVPFIAMLEIVWVLEKVYKFKKEDIREIAEAILNTPELHFDGGAVVEQALRDYAEKNIKFADAVMAHWGLEKGISTVFTYDEKDFKRIEGLKVRKP